MRFLPIFILLFFSLSLSAKTLHIGQGQPYTDITAAAKAAAPGDTIFVHTGAYRGDQSLGSLQGTPAKWIYILADKNVSFEGGSAAWRGTDIAYLHIEGFVFTGQTGNGVNIDDGSTYATPSHHITFRRCTFRDMAATGNNDLLKLSGADELTIQECTFLNGSKGGSGIDMVGCHNSRIIQCRFENMGANAVQMKGGSSNILVEGCVFKNAGSRAINLGGSTGIAFFRPADVAWEAADLKVYSNVFIGAEVPVAFVGCIRSEVVNNTIYKPGRWVVRILQENKDTTRFAKCSDNIFRNNIVCLDDQVRTACSIGSGTAPESFTFSNNLWYHTDNNRWPGPQLPLSESNPVIGKDPLFKEEFAIAGNSPAAAAGFSLQSPQKDHVGKQFLPVRAIGAYEVK